MILENKWYEADTVQDSGFQREGHIQGETRLLILCLRLFYIHMKKKGIPYSQAKDAYLQFFEGAVRFVQNHIAL